MRHDGPRPAMSESERWIRRYTRWASIGYIALVIAVFDGIVFVLWQDISQSLRPWVSILSVALSLGAGYGLQHLFLRRSGVRSRGALDFTYESRVKCPPGITLATVAITSAVFALAVWQFCAAMEYREVCQNWPLSYRQPPGYGEYLTTRFDGSYPISWLLPQISLTAGCMLAAFMGARLRPMQFHQILAHRVLIEHLGFWVFAGAFQAVYVNGGISVLYFICLFIYIICILLTYNQANLVKAAHSSPTCRITNQMRIGGIGEVVRLVLSGLKVFSLVAGGATVIICGGQLLLYGNYTVKPFNFPVAGVTWLNILFFIYGIASWVVFLLLRCMRLSVFGMREKLDEWTERLAKFRRAIWNWIWNWTCDIPQHLLYRRWARKTGKAVAAEAKANPVYEDTVIRRRPRYREEVISPAAFGRRVTALPDIRTRYRYAYRTLVDCMIRKRIGIDLHSTPAQIAAIVRQRTNLSDIEYITLLFEQAAYADALPPPTEDQLARLCDIVREELERERRVNAG